MLVVEDDDSNDDDDEDDDSDDSDGDDDGSDDVDDIDALVESGLAGRRRLQPRSRRNSPFSLSSFTQQTITSINTKILNICQSSFKNTNTSKNFGIYATQLFCPFLGNARVLLVFARTLEFNAMFATMMMMMLMIVMMMMIIMMVMMMTVK